MSRLSVRAERGFVLRMASTTSSGWPAFRALVVGTALVASVVTGCAARQQVALREDAAITKDVQARLAADPAANGSAIAVDTKAGVVSLRGGVETDTIRTSAERIARDTPGVQSVDNEIRFGSTPPH